MYMVIIMMSGSIGWAFKVAATIDTRSDRSSCFTSSGTEANRIGPKIGKLPYFFIIFSLYDYVC